MFGDAGRDRFLFLATVFSVTFEKVYWSVGGTRMLADVLTALFLASFVIDRVAAGDWKLAHTAIVALAFGLAFLAVYLVGFFNLDTTQGIAQFGKGMVKFGLHFGFLAAGVAYLIRHGRRFAFTGVRRLRRRDRRQRRLRDRPARRSRERGSTSTRCCSSPLTRGAARSTSTAPSSGEQSVYRPNALTGDPNHLGIMLLVPLLALTPVYLRQAGGAVLAGLSGSSSSSSSRPCRAAAWSGSASGSSCCSRTTGPSCSRADRGPARDRGGVRRVDRLAPRRLLVEVIRSRIATGDATTSAHFDVSASSRTCSRRIRSSGSA